MRSRGLRGQVPPAASHLVRGLSRARHSHGDHAERRGRDGRRAPARRRQRVVPAAADQRAPGRHRDHEAAPHHHPAEQDRPGEGGPGQGAARADRQVRAGHGGREGARDTDLGAAQVQHRGHLRVPGQEGARARARLHVPAQAHHHPLVRRQQARL